MVEHATVAYYGAFRIGCVHMDMGIALNSRPHMSYGIN